jgi:glyoxylase-like metal-dependent hydrolase (beta-lactamase superfamily II)
MRLVLPTGRPGEAEEVWIRWLGVGHTDGDLVAFVPSQKLVVTGDLFAFGYEPSVDEDAGGRLPELRRALERLLGYPFEQVVPGHGPLAGRADVAAVRDYLAAMESAIRDAVQRGLSEEAAVEAGESALARFPRLEPLPFRSDRKENLRTLYRELQQTAKSAAP